MIFGILGEGGKCKNRTKQQRKKQVGFHGDSLNEGIEDPKQTPV
jgi:hypothetical protein